MTDKRENLTAVAEEYYLEGCDDIGEWGVAKYNCPYCGKYSVSSELYFYSNEYNHAIRASADCHCTHCSKVTTVYSPDAVKIE